MDGSEFFMPSEAGESYDPAAFERFKQQVQANAAFVAALRKGEQRQKQKEDRLFQILLKFIQSNQKSNIVMLVTRLLEENIPASVILAIIVLGNEQLQKEVDESVPQLVAGESVQASTQKNPTMSITETLSDSSIPLRAKIAIDQWVSGIWETSSAIPFRVLETVLDKAGDVKKVVIACSANVLNDYMESMPEVKGDYEVYMKFCEFLLRGIITNLKKQIENQKELK